MKKSNNPLIAAVLCIGLLLCAPQTAYGADFAVGQSLVAGDQAKAGEGLSFPGLEITWLDLGEEDVSSAWRIW